MTCYHEAKQAVSDRHPELSIIKFLDSYQLNPQRLEPFYEIPGQYHLRSQIRY